MSTDATQTQTIAERYADAFFELALEGGLLEKVESDFTNLHKAIEESADLKRFIKSPVFTAEDQTKSVYAIAEKAGFQPLTRNFLTLIAHNRRLFALPEIINAFNDRLATHRGEVRAEAITATALNADQERRLRSEIESVIGKAINLDTQVDADLLGGMIVKVGSTMIDSSLKTKLNRLQSIMKEA